MKRLTLNILIIFLLFISSYQLTDNEKEKIIEAEINQCIYNITNSCGSLYNNPNLNIDYKKNRCIGYCHEFLHTKLQQTMKIFNIPHSDFSELGPKLQQNWSNQSQLYKILRYEFTKDYKKEGETKVNNTLYDLASNISAEIKHYSLHVATNCLIQTNILAKSNCMVMPLQYYLATTFSYYSIITVQEIAGVVLDLEPETQYEVIGKNILVKIKEKMEENKKLRRLNQEEDELYNSIVKLFQDFCSFFW